MKWTGAQVHEEPLARERDKTGKAERMNHVAYF
jgi:hypothetical protein